jgi:hypothetical protein
MDPREPLSVSFEHASIPLYPLQVPTRGRQQLPQCVASATTSPVYAGTVGDAPH